MRTMGLDISLTSTGYSVDGVTGIIKVKSRNAERLHEISNAVLFICFEYSIDIVVLEGYSFASRNSQAHSIGELGGCIRMKLWENSIPYVEIPPTSRAKFATGRGNAGKTEVISSISAKTGLNFSGSGADDECDAWILEQMCKTYLGDSQYQWTKEQLSALEKIDWSQLEGAGSA